MIWNHFVTFLFQQNSTWFTSSNFKIFVLIFMKKFHHRLFVFNLINLLLLFLFFFAKQDIKKIRKRKQWDLTIVPIRAYYKMIKIKTAPTIRQTAYALVLGSGRHSSGLQIWRIGNEFYFLKKFSFCFERLFFFNFFLNVFKCDKISLA